MESLELRNRVKALYEAYPYPAYPLWGKIHWTSGYMNSAWFAHQLAGIKLPQGPQQSCLAGCGDTQAWVYRQWEPHSRAVYGFDLARRNILRSYLRFFRPSLGVIKLRTLALEDWLATEQASEPPISHWDAYGVLHHLVDPLAQIPRLRRRLAPGATLRIMVYNPSQRHWIRTLKRSLKLKGLSFDHPPDYAKALNMVRAWGEANPRLKARLSMMGPSLLNNANRFADAFFHPRESAIRFSTWVQAFENEGFRLLGLFDRYQELDHLPNPLFNPPPAPIIDQLAEDGHFLGNFEFWLRAPGTAPELGPSRSRPLLRFRLGLSSPPKAWFESEETKSISTRLRYRLWQRFNHHISGYQPRTLDALENLLALKTWQRLGRLGAFLPSQWQNQVLFEALKAPMDLAKTEYEWPAAPDLAQPESENSRVDRLVLAMLGSI